jgi:hypothetical protein
MEGFEEVLPPDSFSLSSSAGFAGTGRKRNPALSYAALSASIKTCATSGRVNSGGGGVPARSSSRTLVPLSETC